MSNNGYLKYPISNQLLNLWLRENILFGKGYIMVSDRKKSFAWVEDGSYSIELNGITTLGTTDTTKTIEIFQKLIAKYKNFERNGYAYVFVKGGWHQKRLRLDEQFVQTRKTY